MTVSQRVDQAINVHLEAGVEPKTVVLSPATLSAWMKEVDPTKEISWTWFVDPTTRTQYKGIPVELRDFIADGEVIIGV